MQCKIGKQQQRTTKQQNKNKIQRTLQTISKKALTPKSNTTRITNNLSIKKKSTYSIRSFIMGNENSTISESDTQSLTNYQFYSDKIQSVPDGDFLSGIHRSWFANYSLLERHHGYIQWLFPIREGGMNYESVPLSKHEAQLFRDDVEILNRVIQSYELMLNFYGLVLLDRNTGQIARNPTNYSSRYNHLNHSFHNYLRITRIMKHLGMVGFEHLKFGFLHHMCLEMFKEGELRNASDSFVRFWAPTLRDPEHLKFIDALATKYGRKVNREGRDGYGDEHGKPLWSTELVQTNALISEPIDVFSLDYVTREEVATAPVADTNWINEV